MERDGVNVRVATPLGECAVRYERPRDVDPAVLLDRLRDWPGVRDVVITDVDVAIYFDPAAPPERLDDALAPSDRASLPHPARHVIRVRYDGEDLADIARETALTVDEVVARHASGVYTVAFIGFLPAFAYLDGLDPSLALPRRASPRPRVPAGAVAIAARRTAVYPFASPGGWHIVGTAVDFVAFDPVRGGTLRLGDSVAFERVR